VTKLIIGRWYRNPEIPHVDLYLVNIRKVPPLFQNDHGFFEVYVQGKRLEIDFDGSEAPGQYYIYRVASAEVLFEEIEDPTRGFSG
jgi:hypothetical protein